MLSKDHKLDLRKNRDFFKTSRKISSEFFTLHYLENSESLLFQVVVAKGIAKNAVDRNSIRRSVYDTCAEYLSEYSPKPVSIVIVVRNHTPSLWMSSLRTAIQKVLDIYS